MRERKKRRGEEIKRKKEFKENKSPPFLRDFLPGSCVTCKGSRSRAVM